MNSNIWSSSQMAGTGGALKALAKNLASQLTLNRAEVKRVVARVISECHGQGHVGDYNGHMFYVKPERIDMTQLITHSKEAFDEMIHQKQLRAKKQAQRISPAPGSRSLTYKLKVENNADKSLTGVIIDQNHLRRRRHPADIVLEMSHPAIQIKSNQFIRRKPPAPLKKPINNKGKIKGKSQKQGRPATLCRPKTLTKSQSQMKPKVVKTIKKNFKMTKAEPKPVQRKKLATKAQSRQTLQTTKSRLPAGVAVRPAASVNKQPSKRQIDISNALISPRTTTNTKSGILKATSTKKLTRTKSSNSCRNTTEVRSKRRLSAGGVIPKSRRSRNRMTSLSKKRVNPPWRNPYQFQGGAGATYRSRSAQAKSKTISRTNPQPASKNKPVISVNSVRQMRLKRSQARLAKDLEREEAIDEPERLDAGSMQCYRSKESVAPKRPKRPYKISARLQELALPPLHRRFKPELAPIRSHPRGLKPKPKLRIRRRRRRLVIDSSLGSIEGMRVTSRSGLSPAKRNLTLAFMNKDRSHSPRAMRSRRSVAWR